MWFLVAEQLGDDVAGEEDAQGAALHKVTGASRGVSRRGQGPNSDVAELENLVAFQLDVHRGRVGAVVGHVKDAEEGISRAAGTKDRGIARSGVDLCPGVG